MSRVVSRELDGMGGLGAPISRATRWRRAAGLRSAGLAGALQVLGTPDIFRDLSRGAELLQAVNSVTGGALANSRFMAELVAKTVAAIATGGVSAIGGIGGSAGTPGPSGSVGNTPQVAAAADRRCSPAARPVQVRSNRRRIRRLA